jgi:Amt family ammonium transporter
VASAPAVAAPAPAPLTRPASGGAIQLNGADTGLDDDGHGASLLLMTLPGIALFYGGMVRKKSVINTMASVVAIAAVVTLLWFAFGYSLAFTPGNGWIGGTSRFWFEGLSYLKDAGKVSVSHIAPNIPESVFSMFQLTFAIITPALIVGAFVERMKFSAMLWFIVLWSLLVYAPVAHWVWNRGGWIARMGALDFAGGTVVHVNAGIAGLMCAYFIGPRRGYGREAFEPFKPRPDHGRCRAVVGRLVRFQLRLGGGGGRPRRPGHGGDPHCRRGGRRDPGCWASGSCASGRRYWACVPGSLQVWWPITPAAGFVTPGSAVVIGGIAGLALLLGRHGTQAPAAGR